jgi:hypothetical protein
MRCTGVPAGAPRCRYPVVTLALRGATPTRASTPGCGRRPPPYSSRGHPSAESGGPRRLRGRSNPS